MRSLLISLSLLLAACSSQITGQSRVTVFEGARLITGDGSGLQQITFDEGFDGFPMFTNDGKYLIWGSNRNAKKEGDTNVFVAEWVNTGSSSN